MYDDDAFEYADNYASDRCQVDWQWSVIEYVADTCEIAELRSEHVLGNPVLAGLIKILGDYDQFYQDVHGHHKNDWLRRHGKA